MIEPLQLLWITGIVFLGLSLLVLVEVQRINYRRENEDMFGTRIFDEKVAAIGFTDKEKRTLDKIIRASTFENKDAILNSSKLFEEAVATFYDIRNVFQIRDETLSAVERLREKLNFTASNNLTEIYSTRQFRIGDRIDLVLENGMKIKRSEIAWRNEKEWAISFENEPGVEAPKLEGSVLIRWTRPDDALYSALLPVLRMENGLLVLPHTNKLDKRQLRRWVREQVQFPVTAKFEDESECGGILLDLSAGGIMIGLPKECFPGQRLRINFELPSFGEQVAEIEILRNLGHKSNDFPTYFCMTASFSGAFGWIQETVLQYLFELNKNKKEAKKRAKST